MEKASDYQVLVLVIIWLYYYYCGIFWYW